jgi:hypothetical protein
VSSGKFGLAMTTLSLPKTPSRGKSAIHLAKWNCEIVAKQLGFSDWIKGEMANRGSALNPDRIIPM